jgi:3-isopropylmalate/(R)-2-methylmalate dehydratase small subunit
MQPFEPITAVALPLLRDNIDTDALIPSREITTVSKTGLAAGLFAGWRYIGGDHAKPDPAFELNDPVYRGAEILLAGDNFGCGSSREQAVWALAEFGFRVLAAPSFNPIFYRNCVRNGIVPAMLPPTKIAEIARWVRADPRTNRLCVDLQERVIRATGHRSWEFTISDESRDFLLRGVDAIDETLKLRDKIAAFRAADELRRPWAYEIGAGQGESVKAGSDML